MAYFGSQPNDEFSAGIDHLTAAGRGNDQSITLGDQGLDQTSARWDGMSPHGVIRTAMGAGSQDGSIEDYQRQQGTYTPGSYPELEDQIDQGSDEIG